MNRSNGDATEATLISFEEGAASGQRQAIPDAKSSSRQVLREALAEIEKIIPPLWPLKDYVAVNPFQGLSGEGFYSAQQKLADFLGADILMPLEYYAKLLKSGRLSKAHIDAALSECQRNDPKHFADLRLEKVLEELKTPSRPQGEQASTKIPSISGKLDARAGTHWTETLTQEVSRHCANYFDEGQASWRNPWKMESLYAAWRQTALFDRRPEFLGIQGFRQFASELSPHSEEAIHQLLTRARVPQPQWEKILSSTVLTVMGWACYARYQVWQAEKAGTTCDSLIDLIAIRLAYDVAVFERVLDGDDASLWVDFYDELGSKPASHSSREGQRPIRYVLQRAAEIAWRDDLVADIVRQERPDHARERNRVQAVFCIDVRSEVIRRNLERAAGSAVETYGFAGFFGAALAYQDFGSDRQTAQCPVLLNPSFHVQEGIRNVNPELKLKTFERRTLRRRLRSLWKSFHQSAVSCFTYVESVGLVYLARLIGDSLGLHKPVDDRHDGIPAHLVHCVGPDLDTLALSLQQRIDLCESVLRNLGLAHPMARLVVLVGHGSEVVNNPYQAGLDCGACGGHSGEVNARLVAALLNDSEVRTGLKERGQPIPEDTAFVAALHNTTTDQITLFDTDLVPISHLKDLDQFRWWANEAGHLSRAERSGRLGGIKAKDIFRKSRDWSEVRPEWGLAGNAAFIAAPRWRTEKLNLQGRTFLHSYDSANDPESKVLELIMTAPMVVAQWINLQYYASTVNNTRFGSGNKAIHNVVGKLGVLAGNGGDLQTGLPWQSVHDGVNYQHEPLRLQVLIEASRQRIDTILAKHEAIATLARNEWLYLVAIEDQQAYHYMPDNSWEAIASVGIVMAECGNGEGRVRGSACHSVPSTVHVLPGTSERGAIARARSKESQEMESISHAY